MDKDQRIEELAQSNLALRRIVGSALEALHHDKNGEFANLPRLIEDLKKTDDDLRETNMQLSNNFRHVMERIDSLHELICSGQIGTWQMRIEQVIAQVIKLDSTKTHGPMEQHVETGEL